jgi:hypothetical protein
MKSKSFKAFTLVLVLLSMNCLQATTTSLSPIGKNPKAKKIKIELENGEKYKGYIVKVDDEYVYSVPKKRMVQAAMDNNCKDCAKVPLSAIAKVHKKSKFLLVLGSVLLLLGVGAVIWAGGASNSSGDGGFLFLGLLLLILLGLPVLFFSGWGIGSFLKKKYKGAEAKKYLHEHSAVYYADK